MIQPALDAVRTEELSPVAATHYPWNPAQHVIHTRPQTGAIVTLDVGSAADYLGFYSVYMHGAAANTVVNFGATDLINQTDATLTADKDTYTFYSDGETFMPIRDITT